MDLVHVCLIMTFSNTNIVVDCWRKRDLKQVEKALPLTPLFANEAFTQKLCTCIMGAEVSLYTDLQHKRGDALYTDLQHKRGYAHYTDLQHKRGDALYTDLQH